MAERLSDQRLDQLVALCHCTCTAQPCDCLEPDLATALAELVERRAAGCRHPYYTHNGKGGNRRCVDCGEAL